MSVAVRPSVRVVLNWSFHLSLSLSPLSSLSSCSAAGEICVEEGSVEIIKTGAPRRHLRGILLQ